MGLEYYIGVDFGGTRIRGILYTRTTNKVIQFISREFQQFDTVKDEYQTNVEELISELFFMISDGILKGIGIACAANFDRESGTIIKWPNNPKWQNYELKKNLEEKFSVEVRMEDDCNAVALYLKKFGAGKDFKSFFYITISTGIGCGIIYQNNLFIGERGVAGEFGHIQVEDTGSICACGKMGCLQTVSSGKAVEMQYFQRTGNKLTAKEIFQKNDKIAHSIIQNAEEKLAISVRNLITLFDISTIFIGGGVINGENVFFDNLKERIQNSNGYENITVLRVEESDRFGAMGALALFN